MSLSANRALIVTFVIVAVVQTALPMVGQKVMAPQIVFRSLMHVSIGICIATAIVAGLLQISGRRFGKGALAAFYLGLVSLIALDVCVERAINASA